MSGRVFGDDDTVDETTLFEIGCNVYYFFQ